jgi:cytochrome c peroxidase
LLPEHSYETLVRSAFRAEYWQAGPAEESEMTQMQHNFPLFFGLAIQAYEAMLIADDSRFDRFMEGDTQAMTALEQQGMRVFQGASECHECHQGPEFTAASFTNVRGRGRVPGTALPEVLGFFRTGVSPVVEDAGGAGRDVFGNPFFPAARGNQARGVFKSPTLRNVEFTGPYFHEGGQATLEQVLEFYGRRGDFPDDGNLGPGMNRIRMSAEDRTAMVAFLKALSDDRVRFEQAPFDHPEICVPAGHPEMAPGILQAHDAESAVRLSARDQWALIPAVGKSGNAVPLQTFEELLNGIGKDGSRAHSMAEACSPSAPVQ